MLHTMVDFFDIFDVWRYYFRVLKHAHIYRDILMRDTTVVSHRKIPPTLMSRR